MRRHSNNGHDSLLRCAARCTTLTVCLFGCSLTAAQSSVGDLSPTLPETLRHEGVDVAAVFGGGVNDILNLDIEQLSKVDVVVPSMDVPVTSVSKQESTVGRSPAAVFVITNEMIRRSGATCIPEALRMAPGLEVARVNSNTWAITSRGFNTANANKLLVLIDGRTVYSPVFSGTYWDVQDAVLEDVERIEIIRGPGGTLWGANAVNGVINVITKNTKNTQGAYVESGGGTEEHAMETIRYGGRIGPNGHYRVYGKYFDRGPFYDSSQPAEDSWNQRRFGFRTDWNLGKDGTDTLTVQGDHYAGRDGMTAGIVSTTEPYFEIRKGNAYTSGENLLARWQHVRNEDSDWTLQTYFDNTHRNTLLPSENVRTWDVDFQYRFPINDRHRIVCGTGYRYIHDNCPTTSVFTLGVLPTERSYYIASQFIQDEITLSPDRWTLTLGCKLEQNAFTHFEYQPTIRLLWTPDQKHAIWGAVSRAVRTPSRVDEDLISTSPIAEFPGLLYFRTRGNEAFASEVLMAYEMGYRVQTTERFSWDIATFCNVYDRLTSVDFVYAFLEDEPPPPHWVLETQLENEGTARTYGAELAANWTCSDHWRLYAQYTYLQVHVYDTTAISSDGNSPRNQVYLRSSWNLREDLDVDLAARYVDSLTSLNVPRYITMDVRMAWRPRPCLELAVVGQNLLQAHHYEFGQTIDAYNTQVTEVPRGVYGTVTWRR